MVNIYNQIHKNIWKNNAWDYKMCTKIQDLCLALQTDIPNQYEENSKPHAM